MDIYEEEKQDAEKQFEKIVLGVNNAFSGDLVGMPHGSKISLVKENDPTDRSYLQKGDGV